MLSESYLRKLDIMGYRFLNLNDVTRAKSLQIIPFHSSWSSNSKLWSQLCTKSDFSLLDILAGFEADKKHIFFEVARQCFHWLKVFHLFWEIEAEKINTSVQRLYIRSSGRCDQALERFKICMVLTNICFLEWVTKKRDRDSMDGDNNFECLEVMRADNLKYHLNPLSSNFLWNLKYQS